MVDLNEVFKYVSPIILIACLTLGYVIKHAFNNKKVNAFIPLICAGVGIIANVWYLNSFTLETVVAGAVSGLAATGMHQMFKNLLKLPEMDEDIFIEYGKNEEDSQELTGNHFKK